MGSHDLDDGPDSDEGDEDIDPDLENDDIEKEHVWGGHDDSSYLRGSEMGESMDGDFGEEKDDVREIDINELTNAINNSVKDSLRKYFE